jgi:hypothetical protein
MIINLGGSGDAYFGLPLWLTTECRGRMMRACNVEHLDLLEAFVSAAPETRIASREHEHGRAASGLDQGREAPR